MVMPPLALGGREGRMVRLCARRRERSAGVGIHREVVRRRVGVWRRRVAGRRSVVQRSSRSPSFLTCRLFWHDHTDPASAAIVAQTGRVMAGGGYRVCGLGFKRRQYQKAVARVSWCVEPKEIVWRRQHPGGESKFARTRSAAAVSIQILQSSKWCRLPRYAWGQGSGKTGLVRSKVEVEVMW